MGMEAAVLAGSNRGGGTSAEEKTMGDALEAAENDGASVKDIQSDAGRAGPASPARETWSARSVVCNGWVEVEPAAADGREPLVRQSSGGGGVEGV